MELNGWILAIFAVFGLYLVVLVFALCKMSAEPEAREKKLFK